MLVNTLTDQELVILYHRLNMSMNKSSYKDEKFRQAFKKYEGDIDWKMFFVVSKELTDREVDPMDITILTVGTNSVIFNADGTSVNIGCEDIEFDMVEKIYKIMVKKRGYNDLD